MGHAKDILIDTENLTVEAFEIGYNNIDDIIAYVNTYLPQADEETIRMVANALMVEEWDEEAE